MKYFLLTITLCVISSCKLSTDLGDNYYHLDKYEANDVGYPGGAIVYKSTNENVFRNIRIRGDVLSVKTDSKFIIAKRDPIISWNTNTGILEYFIILKKNDSLIGPMKKEKFVLMVEKLEINIELE
jgi:hypothetical protein